MPDASSYPNWELKVTDWWHAVTRIRGAARGERVVWQIGVGIGSQKIEQVETLDV